MVCSQSSLSEEETARILLSTIREIRLSVMTGELTAV
jgi:hypothetical protein